MKNLPALMISKLTLLFLALHSTPSGAEPTHPTKSAPDVVIYQGSYPGWPWISRTPSGRLVCVWREGTVHEFSAAGRLMLSRSRDQGRTWTPAVTFLDEPGVDDRNVAIQCLSNRDWLVCYNSYAPDPRNPKAPAISRTHTLRTKDAGRTWSKPHPVCDLDARTRSAPIRLKTGELVLPFYRAPGDQSLVGVSSNDGASWEVVEIANGPGFVGDEWDVVELPDGRLLGIIRNSASSPAPETRGWFYQTESRDGGRTWTPARRTNLRDTRSTSPAQIFLHQGRPVVLYSDARMVSVVMAITEDPAFLKWKVEQQLSCYVYRPDNKPIRDGSYPVSASVGPQRRLIVDYVVDGDFHAIVGYFVDVPLTWKHALALPRTGR